MFDRLFWLADSPLSSAAITLVMHAAHFLNCFDQIMVLIDGSMWFACPWLELAGFESGDMSTMTAIEAIQSSVQEGEDEDHNQGAPGSLRANDLSATRTPASLEKSKLMSKETREHGLSHWRTWLLWFRLAGGIHFCSVRLSF